MQRWQFPPARRRVTAAFLGCLVVVLGEGSLHRKVDETVPLDGPEAAPVPSIRGDVSRPQWRELRPDTVLEQFKPNEVLQLYHLEATDKLFERGGLNHELSFQLTALGFQSVDLPDSKVSLVYQPTNMTISLLPEVSFDGQHVRWGFTDASVMFALDIDQSYWSSASYMGSTTGALFNDLALLARQIHAEHPRYQPFSVYKEYPGQVFVSGNDCDDFVWRLLEAANDKGVNLAPTILPKKIKIVIYTEEEPKVVTIDPRRAAGRGGRAAVALAEVVAYYRSLQVCLQEKKYSYIDSLPDFAKYFDCLSDVAFINIDQSTYYKVNLTSNKFEHIVEPEELPPKSSVAALFTAVDLLLVLLILVMLISGTLGLLWRGKVLQLLPVHHLWCGGDTDDSFNGGGGGGGRAGKKGGHRRGCSNGSSGGGDGARGGNGKGEGSGMKICGGDDSSDSDDTLSWVEDCRLRQSSGLPDGPNDEMGGPEDDAGSRGKGNGNGKDNDGRYGGGGSGSCGDREFVPESGRSFDRMGEEADNMEEEDNCSASRRGSALLSGATGCGGCGSNGSEPLSGLIKSGFGRSRSRRRRSHAGPAALRDIVVSASPPPHREAAASTPVLINLADESAVDARRLHDVDSFATVSSLLSRSPLVCIPPGGHGSGGDGGSGGGSGGSGNENGRYSRTASWSGSLSGFRGSRHGSFSRPLGVAANGKSGGEGGGDSRHSGSSMNSGQSADGAGGDNGGSDGSGGGSSGGGGDASGGRRKSLRSIDASTSGGAGMRVAESTPALRPPRAMPPRVLRDETAAHDSDEVCEARHGEALLGRHRERDADLV